MNSYLGRLKYFFATHTNPMLIFVSKSKLKWAVDTIHAYKEKVKAEGDAKGYIMVPKSEIDVLRKAQQIEHAIIHPDTGKKIPAYFRMSWFLPANLPTIVCMLIFQKHYWQVLFFQWLNQTYNAGWNFCNRSASAPFTNRELGMAYGTAVTSSMSVALGARYISNKFFGGIKNPVKNILLNTIVAALAMSVAGSLNILMIRQNELKYGIDVKDEEGNTIGKSQNAAKKAIQTSAVTRMVVPLTNIAFIPVYFWLMQKYAKKGCPFPSGNARFVSHKAISVAIQLTCALPLALAIFPHTIKMPTSQLEDKFKKVDYAFFNKGLQALLYFEVQLCLY
eukprot:TRINITY_DN257_c0_g1_i1.p1 TRINITY_DN257_c0_g1~~TRINITY_DN257_c0_g1_i1.p1  ORF type:complete len:355 (+),score=35.54 TRINITY_DN257_c0_g1_i1:62-1066(+)